MKRLRTLLFSIPLLALLAPALIAGAALEARGQESPPDSAAGLLQRAREEGPVRVIVRLEVPFAPEGVLAAQEAQVQRARISEAQERLVRLLAPHNVKGIKRFRFIPFMALEASPAALEALSKTPLVAAVAQDVPLPPSLADSVPLINADSAWAAGYTGAGQTVAILDSGVDKTHSFLDEGKVVAEACFSTNSDQSQSLCPNGQSSQIGSGAGVNCSGVAGCEHGTHVAGIAAGSGGSINGVAKDAKIISIQVFSRFDSSSACSTTSPCLMSFISDLIAALEHVYSLRDSYKIAAVNMSLGGGYYTAHCDSDPAYSPAKSAIDNLRAAGIATVIASGNSGQCGGITAPACISTAVSVGATTKDDLQAYFSNYAQIMDLFAPGDFINSSVPGGWAEMSGTSMSAPHVTGAFAILKQKNPQASVEEILNAITSSGVPITSPCDGTQKPRVDVAAALDALLAPPAAPTNLAAKAISSSAIVLTWTDRSNNEAGFRIERKAGWCGSANPWAQVAFVGANVKSWTNTGLPADTAYAYRVRAYNADGSSGYTACAASKTGPAGAPNSPTGLKATGVSSERIDISWTDKSSDETGFNIFRKAGGGTWALLAQVGANTTGYTDTTAAGNSSTTAYSYYVTACNNAGCSPSTSTAAVPFRPAGLSASAGASSGRISLAWTDLSGNETGFKILRKTGTCSSAGPWSTIATLGANRTSYTNTGLTPGVTYSYKARAYFSSYASPVAWGYSLTSNCSEATAP